MPPMFEIDRTDLTPLVKSIFGRNMIYYVSQSIYHFKINCLGETPLIDSLIFNIHGTTVEYEFARTSSFSNNISTTAELVAAYLYTFCSYSYDNYKFHDNEETFRKSKYELLDMLHKRIAADHSIITFGETHSYQEMCKYLLVKLATRMASIYNGLLDPRYKNVESFIKAIETNPIEYISYEYESVNKNFTLKFGQSTAILIRLYAKALIG